MSLEKLTNTLKNSQDRKLSRLASCAELEAARRYLLDFIIYTYNEPVYDRSKKRWTIAKPYLVDDFHIHLCSVLDGFIRYVEKRKSPRLIINAPPRHGKSEAISRRLPALYFGRNPSDELIATSYASDLAMSMSRDVQRIIDTERFGHLFPETQLSSSNIRNTALGKWRRTAELFEIVKYSGQYRAAGVGGGITGMGANILIIDDPIKSIDQAVSDTYKRKIYDWYINDAYTRLAPGGGVLIIQTRWTTDDLTGRLIEQANKKGDKFIVVNYPAISTGKDDPLDRKENEPLSPSRYPIQELNKIKSVLGERFTALYMGAPVDSGGNLINKHWIKRYTSTEDIKETIRVQSWDTGQKEETKHDYSVCETWASGRFGEYLLDVYRDKLIFPSLVKAVKRQAERWNPQAILIEDKSSGSSLIQQLRSTTRLPIIAINPVKDKLTRFSAVTPLFESGLINLPVYAEWLADYESELFSFPLSPNDDQVDATSQYLAWSSERGTLGILGLTGIHEDD